MTITSQWHWCCVNLMPSFCLKWDEKEFSRNCRLNAQKSATCSIQFYATPNARSPRHVRVRGATNVTASDDRSWRRPTAATSWQSSVKHCGTSPCSALNTSTASLNWTRWRTGSQCSCRRAGDMLPNKSWQIYISINVRQSQNNKFIWNLWCIVSKIIGGIFLAHPL